MPTIITSDKTITIENSLDSGPNYPDANRPVVLLAVVAWVTHLFRLILGFTTSTLGLFDDNLRSLQDRIAKLEEESSDDDEDAPSLSPSRARTDIRPAQPKASDTKCTRCSARGHDTKSCRTTNPDLVKKRIANNKKMKKEADRLRTRYPPTYMPHHIPPSRQYYDQLDFNYETPTISPLSRHGTTMRSMIAVHKDAEEFRRRQAQSARDRRKGKSRGTT